MKGGKDKVEALVELFTRIMNKYNELGKKPWDFGTGATLYPAEIHAVSAIGRGQPVNMTELSRRLGVTKGAVSQMASRLEKKGLVKRFKVDDNDKSVLLGLTKLGRKANDGHVRFHREMYDDLSLLIRSISREQFMFFRDTLARIENHLDRYSDGV